MFMEYIYGKTDFRFYNTCVTLGKFDGLHKGHQRLFEELSTYEKHGLTSVMFTFDYHPGNLFSEKEIDLIYTEEEKRRLLERSGPNILISYPFTEETASMEPEDFIKDVLMEKLNAQAIVVGVDYRFGKQRRGDVMMLEKYQEVFGYDLIVCEKLTYDGKIVSSTRIREELKKGNMESVNAMLGHPYTIMGEVVHGKKLGRTLGIPTINQVPPEHKLLPPNGVYASVTRFEGKRYFGVTNIGTKPTVTGEKVTGVETFLFDYKGDLYGKNVDVEIYAYERPEYKFNNLQELADYMQKDVIFAKEYFKDKMIP